MEGISTQERKYLDKAKELGFGRVIKRMIDNAEDKLGSFVEQGRYASRISEEEDKISAYKLWPAIQQLAENRELLYMARSKGVNLNGLVWRAIQRTGNPNDYSESEILDMHLDTPLFIIEYNLWPEVRKLVGSIPDFSKKLPKSVASDIVALIGVINLELPNEAIINMMLVGYDYHRIDSICDGINTVILDPKIPDHTRQKLKTLNSLICDPNSYYWQSKLQRDFGIYTKPDYSNWKGEYISYEGLNNNNERLLEAARNGQLAGVKRFLGQGADVNTSAPLIYNTSLQKPRFGGFERWPVEPEVVGGGQRPLIFACGNGHLEIVKVLLENRANINKTDAKGGTALMFASVNNYPDIVKLLLTRGANVNAVDSDLKTALMLATERGHLKVVGLLLANGANVNAVDDRGDTALYIAIEAKRPDIVELLIRNGADVNNGSSYTHPLFEAIQQEQPRIVELLLNNGANIEATAGSGETVLMAASSNGQLDIVKSLLLRGANINATDTYGKTALMRASSAGRTDTVNFLLDNGADVNAKDERGRSALAILSRRSYHSPDELKIMELLKSYGGE